MGCAVCYPIGVVHYLTGVRCAVCVRDGVYYLAGVISIIYPKISRK
jgi:hypothetical protein